MEKEDERLGRVELSPAGPVVAGSVGEWTLKLTVGSYGIDEGGTIKIAQRFASDWETPQFDRPKDSGYTTAKTTGEAQLALRYEKKGHVRPWMRCLTIDVYDGSLAPGDVVAIVMGDRGEGSPGIRAQSFQESRHEFLTLVDPTNACLVRPLSTSPEFSIVADVAAELVCLLPGDCVEGESVEIFVRGRDKWGNPTEAPGQVSLASSGGGKAMFDGRRATPEGAGVFRALARCKNLSTVSNPMTVHAGAPKARRYWGDLHAQTAAAVGTGTEREYFKFARDVARLDFTSHQANDFQVTDEDWRRLNEVVREFHANDSFVVFPGYEWSANTTAGGDRNVFYLKEDLPIIRSSHWQVPEAVETSVTPAHPADEFFRRMREKVDLNQVIVAAHVGGRYADIRNYMDDELAPLVEVVSCWGEFEWLLWDAFEKGHIVGVMCNSDGHKGRPGDEGPGAGQFGIGNGLTCVIAESLRRDEVFAALKNRRCYGTSGPRIRLSFEVDGHSMGAVFESESVATVKAAVEGTAPIESLQLFRGKELVSESRPTEFDDLVKSKRVRVCWGGARIRGRGRRVVWDGSISLDDGSIVRAEAVGFDSPLDGIQDWDASGVRFRSRTTGDMDGIDLWLYDADQGVIELTTPVGGMRVDVAELGVEPIVEKYGGVEMRVSIRRYPETVSTWSASLEEEIETEINRQTPLFVKAIQTDGHSAWSSPVYVTRRK